MIDEVTLEMVVLQLFPFLLTVVGLHLIIFKPMLAHLADRERNIDGFKHEAELLSEEVAAKLAELEAKLVQARAEAAAERAALRAENKVSEAGILAEARERAEVHLAQARETLSGEQARASEELKATAHTLSSKIATTILGRPVAGN